MHTTNLRKVGGSVMLAVPARTTRHPGAAAWSFRSASRLKADGWSSSPQRRPRYTLDELPRPVQFQSGAQQARNVTGSAASRQEPRSSDEAWRKSGLLGLDPSEGHEQKGRPPGPDRIAGGVQPGNPKCPWFLAIASGGKLRADSRVSPSR